jgi:hypothetical protein
LSEHASSGCVASVPGRKSLRSPIVRPGLGGEAAAWFAMHCRCAPPPGTC